MEHVKIASLFHRKPLEHIPAHILKEVHFSSDFSEAEKAGVRDLILKNDAFMIESFVRNHDRKKLEHISPKIVK